MTVVCSLSSGAILSVAVQTMLIVWDKITASVARRWAILSLLLLPILPRRHPSSALEVFISYLTFSLTIRTCACTSGTMGRRRC